MLGFHRHQAPGIKMLTKCNHCGEIAVDDSENQEVCHACGIVAGETKLSTSGYLPYSAPRAYVPFTRFEAKIQKKKKRSICLEYGLNILDRLCHANNVHLNLKVQITELFKNICKVRQFRLKEHAGVTAACCVFLIQRKNKQAIPINTICRQTGCTRGKFSYYLNFMKSYLSVFQNEENSSFDASASTSLEEEKDSEGHFSDIVTSLIREVCDKADSNEKSKLLKKVTALVKLADDCWLLTGRSPRSVVVASAYLCWKSMHPLRRKASFPKFCSLFDIRETMAKQRIPELRAFLLKLGRKIPSYNKNLVNEDNLTFHLDTILENSESLRNDLLTDIHEAEAINCREFSNFRFPAQYQPRKEPTSPVVYDPDMKASDIEISDTEIDSYILSDTKKKFIELWDEKEND